MQSFGSVVHANMEMGQVKSCHKQAWESSPETPLSQKTVRTFLQGSGVLCTITGHKGVGQRFHFTGSAGLVPLTWDTFQAGDCSLQGLFSPSCCPCKQLPGPFPLSRAPPAQGITDLLLPTEPWLEGNVPGCVFLPCSPCLGIITGICLAASKGEGEWEAWLQRNGWVAARCFHIPSLLQWGGENNTLPC